MVIHDAADGKSLSSDVMHVMLDGDLIMDAYHSGEDNNSEYHMIPNFTLEFIMGVLLNTANVEAQTLALQTLSSFTNVHKEQSPQLDNGAQLSTPPRLNPPTYFAHHTPSSFELVAQDNADYDDTTSNDPTIMIDNDDDDVSSSDNVSDTSYGTTNGNSTKTSNHT